MKLLGKSKLHELISRDERLRAWAVSWTAEVERAVWHSLVDVIDQFPRAEYLEAGLVRFPIGLTGWSITVQTAYAEKIALVIGYSEQK